MTADTAKSKFQQATKDLVHALGFEKKVKEDRFYLAGIEKSFESALEYAWKYFRALAIEEGLEVYSPKDAIKAAGQLEIIDNVEEWLTFLKYRNTAAHDYLGISSEDYLKAINRFARIVQKFEDW